MSTIHTTLSFLVFFSFNFRDMLAISTTQCRPEQRNALLEFKNEFEVQNSSSGDCYINCGSKNQFSGQIPSSIGNLSRLVILGLSGNNFFGEIPSTFGSLYQLASLRVISNNLSGNFPFTLLNLTNLSYLSLSYNQFTGTLPPNITSLSNLEEFEVDNNAFFGTFPYLTNNQLDGTLFSPSKLRGLNLGSNNFRGPIPRSISKLVNLEWLEMSHWDTQGPVDFNIFLHLKSLRALDLSYMNTTTKINLTAISSFSESLDTLDLSGNHVLATNKSSVSDPPLKLIRQLILSGCGITEFPEILRTQQNMAFLDISSNKIKGQVPGWLWKLTNLKGVDLSYNNLIGFERSTKQGLSPELQTLDISNNKIKVSKDQSSALQYLIGSRNNFTGNIPSLVCEWRSLIILDLSVNDFSGSIPNCLENLKSNLSYLSLRHNHLSGSIPGNVIESLRSLDVSHNQLVGKLPRSLMNFSALEVLNVESNRINDVFPSWLSSLQNLQILILRSNAFHGPIHQASRDSRICRLTERASFTQHVKQCLHWTHPLFDGESDISRVT
ncbi:unnamed protein product [Brassica napus]|uniref:(rape) hypothetical protein n=1 Tax=Brassica napus TaxID=3708 RepID=A0A816JSJ9_BRANA|nr:unnamed protein product [Brassica napus]